MFFADVEEIRARERARNNVRRAELLQMRQEQLELLREKKEEEGGGSWSKSCWRLSLLTVLCSVDCFLWRSTSNQMACFHRDILSGGWMTMSEWKCVQYAPWLSVHVTIYRLGGSVHYIWKESKNVLEVLVGQLVTGRGWRLTIQASKTQLLY